MLLPIFHKHIILFSFFACTPQTLLRCMNQNASKNIYPVQTNSAFIKFIKKPKKPKQTKAKHQKKPTNSKNQTKTTEKNRLKQRLREFSAGRFKQLK